MTQTAVGKAKEFWVVQSPGLGEVVLFDEPNAEEGAKKLFSEEFQRHGEKASLKALVYYSAYEEMKNRKEALERERDSLQEQLGHCSKAYQDLGNTWNEDCKKLEKQNAELRSEIERLKADK
jgi:hypothetical protein